MFLIIPSCSKQPLYRERVCACVCTVAAKWSLYLPPTSSLSLDSGVCLFCPLIIKKKTPHPLRSPSLPTFFSLSSSPLLLLLLLLHFPLSHPLSLPLLISLYLSVTHYPTAWSTQSAVCEWECHLTLLACVILCLLVALNFALNLWLFLCFLTVRLINQAARSRHPAICECISQFRAGFELLFALNSRLSCSFLSD